MSQLRREIKQSRPFGTLAEEVILNLFRTADQLGAAEAALLKPHGLTPAQYNVLRILRGAGPDGHPCQEIAARMITRVPDVTRLVDRLVEGGLVDRERSEEDRRVVRVRIRPAGLELLARLDGPVSQEPTRLLGALSERELATLNRLLVRIRTPG